LHALSDIISNSITTINTFCFYHLPQGKIFKPRIVNFFMIETGIQGMAGMIDCARRNYQEEFERRGQGFTEGYLEGARRGPIGSAFRAVFEPFARARYLAAEGALENMASRTS
jgi:hypothetical protein